MFAKKEIEAAIGAHGEWKTRLHSAIDKGSSEFTPAVVETDSQCEFGKFLYQKADAATQASDHYRKCRELHAAFHRSAALVLRHALAGKREEAKKEMGMGGEFSKASASLVSAMMNWAKSTA